MIDPDRNDYISYKTNLRSLLSCSLTEVIRFFKSDNNGQILRQCSGWNAAWLLYLWEIYCPWKTLWYFLLFHIPCIKKIILPNHSTIFFILIGRGYVPVGMVPQTDQIRTLQGEIWFSVWGSSAAHCRVGILTTQPWSICQKQIKRYLSPSYPKQTPQIRYQTFVNGKLFCITNHQRLLLAWCM